MGDVGLVMDAILMLLLVAALAFGVRLEKKLSALRAGQAAFAGAVTDLNQAAARAEAALASLRVASQETDMLHDRIVKARQLKAELEGFTERRAIQMTARPEPRAAEPVEAPVPSVDDVQALVRGSGPDRFTPVLQALAANQAAQQRLNHARRSLDDDLFAA